MPYRNYYKCTIDGCEGSQRGRGYCFKHYQRFMKYGDPLFSKYTRGEDRDNLIADILAFKNKDDCLFVNAAIHPRIICRLAHGKPPNGKNDAAHSCGNGGNGAGYLRCVNPHHLRWTNRTENMADAIAHGTTVRIIIPKKTVQRVRLLDGKISRRKIAKKFHLSLSTVNRIIWRQDSWADR